MHSPDITGNLADVAVDAIACKSVGGIAGGSAGTHHDKSAEGRW